MSPTLASAPAGCCFSGVKHTGTPIGRIEDLGGMQTYISEPPSSAATQKVILFLADVWGPLFVNNQLLQDYFASCGASFFDCSWNESEMVEVGYLVLGPDYFFGDAIPNHEPGRDRQAWIMGSRKPAIDAFPAWLDAVKVKYGTSIFPASSCVLSSIRGIGSEKKYCAVGTSVYKQVQEIFKLCGQGTALEPRSLWTCVPQGL